MTDQNVREIHNTKCLHWKSEGGLLAQWIAQDVGSLCPYLNAYMLVQALPSTLVFSSAHLERQQVFRFLPPTWETQTSSRLLVLLPGPAQAFECTPIVDCLLYVILNTYNYIYDTVTYTLYSYMQYISSFHNIRQVSNL